MSEAPIRPAEEIARELGDGPIRLRRPDEGDLEALVAAVRSSLAHLQPWMVWAVDDYGVDEAREFVDAVQAGDELSFVLDGGPGVVLGGCGLNRIDPVHRTANLGYWLRADATGRGLATRAARLVLLHALGDLGLERIEVVVSVANAASRAVAERLGLSAEDTRRRALRIGGEQHDADVFVALREHLGVLAQDR